ncbi:MAG TPA: hypothetical protein VMN57_14045 [Anaerolineales bacterium]|nr:hypothetical protein [Anaerolineales bacterium]
MGIKSILGNLPYTAELYWQFRQKDSPTTVGLNLSRLKEVLPGWVETAQAARAQATPGRKVLVFGMIHYWLEHTTLLSLTLAALGHEVTYAFMPYSHWRKSENRFDLRRQNAYILDVLRPVGDLLRIVSFFDRSPVPRHRSGDALEKDVLENQALRDTQYSLLTEEVESGSDLYNLRLERDAAMGAAVVAHLAADRPDVVVTPNGSILEFGVLYHAARARSIPVSTFEFGEQNYRMWLAQGDDVMRQDTTALWEARGDIPLTEAEWDRVRTMFTARQGASVFETFERTWQTADSKGARQIRTELGLDDRPLAFLPTNVLGDSLTLGRQVFIGMTEWIRRTIRWFGDHPAYQLVVRIHPGEGIGWGPSTFDLLKDAFPEFPSNVHVLSADYAVNSYDLVDAARAGLVYTTTLGLEMAMLGLPVIVLGQTHYRGKGFTHEPPDWDAYLAALQAALDDPTAHAPGPDAVATAWTYAYRFFFEYPQPFPWHIQHFWECLDEWPLERVLSDKGRAAFGGTFAALVGEKVLFD